MKFKVVINNGKSTWFINAFDRVEAAEKVKKSPLYKQGVIKQFKIETL